MKIDVDQTLIAYNGDPMTENGDEDSPPATLKRVLVQACLNAQEQDGEQKYRVYRLMKRIDAGGEIDLPSEDITKLKELVGKSYNVAVVGPVYDALEQT